MKRTAWVTTGYDDKGDEIESKVKYLATWEPPDPSVGVFQGQWIIEDVRFCGDGSPVPEEIIKEYEEDWRDEASREAEERIG